MCITKNSYIRNIFINSATDQVLVLEDTGIEEWSVAPVAPVLDEAG